MISITLSTLKTHLLDDPVPPVPTVSSQWHWPFGKHLFCFVFVSLVSPTSPGYRCPCFSIEDAHPILFSHTESAHREGSDHLVHSDPTLFLPISSTELFRSHLPTAQPNPSNQGFLSGATVQRVNLLMVPRCETPLLKCTLLNTYYLLLLITTSTTNYYRLQ